MGQCNSCSNQQTNTKRSKSDKKAPIASLLSKQESLGANNNNVASYQAQAVEVQRERLEKFIEVSKAGASILAQNPNEAQQENPIKLNLEKSQLENEGTATKKQENHQSHHRTKSKEHHHQVDHGHHSHSHKHHHRDEHHHLQKHHEHHHEHKHSHKHHENHHEDKHHHHHDHHKSHKHHHSSGHHSPSDKKGSESDHKHSSKGQHSPNLSGAEHKQVKHQESHTPAPKPAGKEYLVGDISAIEEVEEPARETVAVRKQRFNQLKHDNNIAELVNKISAVPEEEEEHQQPQQIIEHLTIDVIKTETNLHKNSSDHSIKPIRKACIIFDWDDTLLPTTYLRPYHNDAHKKIPSHVLDQLNELDKFASQLLQLAYRLGHIYIITQSQLLDKIPIKPE